MGACCGKSEGPAQVNGGSYQNLAGDNDKQHFANKIVEAGKDKTGMRKPLTREEFSGIALFEIDEAKMQFKDKWFACVSLGEQTFRTATSPNTDKPVWNSKKNVALEETGPRLARISVFETNVLKKNTLVGVCDIDLTRILSKENLGEQEKELVDPVMPTKPVGTIKLHCQAKSKEATEKDFVARLLRMGDVNEDNELSQDEFVALIKAFGNRQNSSELKRLFAMADKDKSGKVSIEELSTLIINNKESTIEIKHCPVCGEKLSVMSDIQGIVHMSLCFDNGTGSQIMQGGFLTEKQAAQGWMFKLSEWAMNASYDVGLNEGAGAMHILVFDRQTGRLQEELIDPKIIIAMRAIYQSRTGLALLDAGTKKMLESISKKQGLRMASEESAKEIPKFIEFFKDQVNMDDVLRPTESFKTFNEFFIRELKPGARPIAYPEQDVVAVCGADCRLMAFRNISDSTRLWIKGRKFSVAGLLADEKLAQEFEGGSLVVFRLAPQDYHRFHSPISGTLGALTDVPGTLFTVNPIAVNSKYCNVFTENKRVVTIINSPDFGDVAFVAIGATMVGSITFTKEAGASVKKGDELGYFSFGGSTCIAVFQAGAIDLDEDLLVNSDRSLETLVRMGQTLGVVPGVAYTGPSSKNAEVTIDDAVFKQAEDAMRQRTRGSAEPSDAL